MLAHVVVSKYTDHTPMPRTGLEHLLATPEGFWGLSKFPESADR